MTLKSLIEKKWFYIVLFGAQLILLPITSKNFEFSEIGNILGKIFSNSIMGSLKPYYPYFQIPSLLILIALVVLKNKVKTLFTIYVIISYVLFSFLQNIAITKEYGLSIASLNVVLFLFVAYAWLYELLNLKNDYSFNNLNWKTGWLIPISILCFWWPLNWNTLEFTTDITLFLTCGSSLAFCAMTPVFLSIMTLSIPNVNITTYRITALVGFIIGCYNMINFVNPKTTNIAILHLPLLIISIYTLSIGYKKEYDKL